MPLHTIITENLKFIDGKTYWELTPDAIMEIGDARYVKLARKGLNHGFTRLCLEHEGDLYGDYKHLSLVESLGYTSIMKLRNVAQSKSLLEATHKDVPAVFRKRKAEPNTAARMSRVQQRERREHPDVLSITVPEIDGQGALELTVKRLLTEREDLVIPAGHGACREGHRLHPPRGA